MVTLTRFQINFVSWSLIVFGVFLSLIGFYFHFEGIWNVLLLCSNIGSYLVGAFMLYLGQKFRFFIINPSRIFFKEGASEKIFFVRPWLEEKETRWTCYLYYFGVEVSKPYRIVEIRVHDMKEPYSFEKCVKNNGISKNGIRIECSEGPGEYRLELFFDNQLRMDVNAIISIKIERGGEVLAERNTYLEYDIVYKITKYLPIKFKDSMRIF